MSLKRTEYESLVPKSSKTIKKYVEVYESWPNTQLQLNFLTKDLVSDRLRVGRYLRSTNLEFYSNERPCARVPLTYR